MGVLFSRGENDGAMTLLGWISTRPSSGVRAMMRIGLRMLRLFRLSHLESGGVVRREICDVDVSDGFFGSHSCATKLNVSYSPALNR